LSDFFAFPVECEHLSLKLAVDNIFYNYIYMDSSSLTAWRSALPMETICRPTGSASTFILNISKSCNKVQ